MVDLESCLNRHDLIHLIFKCHHILVHLPHQMTMLIFHLSLLTLHFGNHLIKHVEVMTYLIVKLLNIPDGREAEKLLKRSRGDCRPLRFLHVSDRPTRLNTQFD